MPRKKTLLRGEETKVIREYLKEHRWSKVSDVVAALKELGFEITDQKVYAVRSDNKRRKSKRRIAKTLAMTQNGTSNSTYTMPELAATKRFVQSVDCPKRRLELLKLWAAVFA